MKKLTIFFALFVMAALATYGQPTLTASTSNPALGDVFYNYFCNTTGVPVGASGVGVVWDYRSLSVRTSDTTYVETCASTPYCDSFPTATLVENRRPDSMFTYMHPYSAELQYVGWHCPVTLGNGYVNYVTPLTVIKYPATYGSNFRDSNFYLYNMPGWGNSHIYVTSHSVVDGFGTLMTPAGTYPDVLRVHRTDSVNDTSYRTGIPTVFHFIEDVYFWYRPGFHNPLLFIDIVTNSAMPPSTKTVEYNSGPLATGIEMTGNGIGPIAIYPNPTTNELHIKANNNDLDGANLTLYDATGRQIYATGQNSGGEVSIVLGQFPAGIYTLRIQNKTFTTMQKVTLMR